MAYSIVRALAPVFLVLLIGFGAGKRKAADNRNVAQLNIFLMDFALPGALFLSAFQTPWAGIAGQLPLALILTVTMWLAYGLVYALSRTAWGRSSPEAAVLSLTAGLPNYAALGLPMLGGVLGEGPAASLSVAVAIACGATLITPVCLMSLEKGKRAESGVRDSFLLPRLFAASLRKPIVFAPLIGAALSFLMGQAGVAAPELIASALKPLGAAALGTALFLTGLILSARELRFSLPVFASLVVKNLAMPLFAFFFARLLGVDARTARSAVLLLALSAGFFGVLFGIRYGADSADAEGALLASTAVFPLTILVVILMTE